MIDIKSLDLAELTEEILQMGEKGFRAKQMYAWMHQKLAGGFDEMTNIPKMLREACKEAFSYTALTLVREQESKIDGTKKFLFACADGNLLESVWMKYKHGNSVCISTQIGCRMGCSFCASALGGLTRNLTPSEMLDQIYMITKLTGERVSNVVVMGTGEPLDNYDALLKFITLLCNEGGLHISQRNITVSTCGIVPKIYELAQQRLQITLAISLHAVTDEKRKELMPIANRYTIEELLKACREYFQKTGRRISFEYSLLAGVNDKDKDAELLAKLAKQANAHVNLIPVNPVRERNFVRPNAQVVQGFKNKLEKNKINVTIRREMGKDIDGACGQLRKRHKDGEEGKRC